MRLVNADHFLNTVIRNCPIEDGGIPIGDFATHCKILKLYPTIEPKWLYRLESTSEDNGLWYNSNNEFVWGIGKLPECKTKDLPMDYDERYHKDGRNWFSSCSRKEDLMHWYSVKDATDLIANGFVFTRYLATEYVEYELETTFIKETSLVREEISIEELFGTAEKPRWISVEESLPKLVPCTAGTAYSNAVNALTSGRKVITAIWDGTDFIGDAAFWEAEDEVITHWAPVLLPLPPQLKEHDTWEE